MDSCVGTTTQPVIHLIPVARNIQVKTMVPSPLVQNVQKCNVGCDTYILSPNPSTDDKSSDELDITFKNNRISEWQLRCSNAGVNIGAVIDSGAVLSTINFQTYTRFKHALTLTNATDKRIWGVGGYPVKIHGALQTLVLINSKEYDVTFIVMDSVLHHGVAEPMLTFALPTDIVIPANSEMAVQLELEPTHERHF